LTSHYAILYYVSYNHFHFFNQSKPVSISVETLIMSQVLQVLPGQPIVQPMAHPLYITTASGRSDYPGKYKYVLLSKTVAEDTELLSNVFSVTSSVCIDFTTLA